MASQDNWRFCTRCYGLFWYGYPTFGVCPSGGAHSPLQAASPTNAGSSWDFTLTVANTNPAPVSTGLQMQYQLMTEWCWIAVATSIGRFYNPGSAWTQCSLLTEQLQANNNMTGQCCPDAQLISATPGLAQALADPYSPSALWALESVNAELPATPPICNHSGDIDKALSQLANLGQDTGSAASMSSLVSELSAGRPVCIYIVWSDGHSHVIAAAGAEEPDTVIVKDPVNGIWVGPYETLLTSYQGDGTWTSSTYTQPQPPL